MLQLTTDYLMNYVQYSVSCTHSILQTSMKKTSTLVMGLEYDLKLEDDPKLLTLKAKMKTK